MATSWFKYNGGPVCDPLSYTIIAIPNCPFPKAQLCAIFAAVQLIGGKRRPYITPSLCTEILTAIATLTESSNVKLCP